MPATFTIAIEAPRLLLKVQIGGFFLPEDVAAYATAFQQARAMLPCLPGQHLTLADTTALRIQSREVVDAFAALMRDPDTRSRRIAFIVGASLARQQIRRIADPLHDHVAYFADRASAEAWLFEDGVSGDRTVFQYRHAPISPMSDDHGCTARNAG